MEGDRQRRAESLWETHRGAPFPERLRGEQLAGIDLVALETHVSACVESWRAHEGALSQDELRSLQRCSHELGAVLPLLSDCDERTYFAHLRDVTEIVLHPDGVAPG